MKRIIRWLFPLLALGFLGCKTTPNFGPAQCEAATRLAASIAVRIAEVTDEEKAPLIAEYASIAEDIATFGCAFVPPLGPEHLDRALLQECPHPAQDQEGCYEPSSSGHV